MRIEKFRSTRDIVLTNPQGERIRIVKFVKADGRNLQGSIGIDAPGWLVTHEPRRRPEKPA